MGLVFIDTVMQKGNPDVDSSLVFLTYLILVKLSQVYHITLKMSKPRPREYKSLFLGFRTSWQEGFNFQQPT